MITKMKKIIYTLMAVTALTMISCQPGSNEPTQLSQQERQLKQAVSADVNNNIIPTYSALAQEALTLAEKTQDMLDKFDAGNLTEADVQAAIDAWVKARAHWELSESFLFGPVSDLNVDPHIDSWPLAKDDLLSLLNNATQMAAIEADPSWVSANLGYGLLGFHAIEYMLYDPDNDDPTNVRVHDITSYTRAELVYTNAVAQDLAGQVNMLYACWVGIDKLSQAQKDFLEELELEKSDYRDPYNAKMIELNSSIYKTYGAVADQIMQGCVDIADEVGNTKIGTPNGAADEAAKNYIESPYALNSIVDFQDNIKSIKNSFAGKGVSGEYTLYQFFVDNGYQADADATLTLIDESITTIAAIPEPFITNAKTSQADVAVAKVGTDLVNQLTKMQGLIETILNKK